MNASRSEPGINPTATADMKMASAIDTWGEPDGPALPRPKNRIVRAGVNICLIGFVIALLGVWQLAKQKTHATQLAHFTHKTGLLTMLSGFVAMMFGFRDAWTRSQMAKSPKQLSLPGSPSHTAEIDWRDTPWKTS